MVNKISVPRNISWHYKDKGITTFILPHTFQSTRMMKYVRISSGYPESLGRNTGWAWKKWAQSCIHLYISYEGRFRLVNVLLLQCNVWIPIDVTASASPNKFPLLPLMHWAISLSLSSHEERLCEMLLAFSFPHPQAMSIACESNSALDWGKWKITLLRWVEVRWALLAFHTKNIFRLRTDTWKGPFLVSYEAQLS